MVYVVLVFLRTTSSFFSVGISEETTAPFNCTSRPLLDTAWVVTFADAATLVALTTPDNVSSTSETVAVVTNFTMTRSGYATALPAIDK